MMVIRLLMQADLKFVTTAATGSCVKFSRKQRSFLNILQVYTHLNVNFLHNC